MHGTNIIYPAYRHAINTRYAVLLLNIAVLMLALIPTVAEHTANHSLE